MDSKVVNKAIAREIRPLLKAAGFSLFSGRTSWRFDSQRIDVINFQSFNSYHAEVIGCTSYSFSVNLGCYFSCIPDRYGIKEKDGQKCPAEYQCHFRGHLHRTFEQAGLERKDIWLIDTGGVFLPRAMADVQQQLSAAGLPWFARFSDLTEVLRVLQAEPEQMDTLWGFGRNPSPIRSFMTGYVARAVGNETLAEVSLRAAAASGCYPELSEDMNKINPASETMPPKRPSSS